MSVPEAALPSRADGPASGDCDPRPVTGSQPNGWLYLAAGLAVVASIALILAAYLT